MSNRIPPRGAWPVEAYVWLAVAAYTAVLAGLALSGHYFFVTKTAIAPWLLVLGFQYAGHRAVIRDWSLPIVAVVLFDCSRGLIYGAITAGMLPVYGAYALEWDRALFGAALPELAQPSLRAAWIDQIAIAVHASHYVFFLAFGVTVWIYSRYAFHRWARGLYGVLGIGAATYALVPTRPPWMAGLDFERIAMQFYNVHVPELVAGLDSNPVAAMPSLHVALPVYCAVIGTQIGGWRAGLPLWTYVGAVTFSVFYLGEHYGVDAIAGIVVSTVCALAVRRGMSDGGV